MSRKTEIVIEEGSTNVYADLGYADSAEMQRKSQLAAEITRAIKARRLTQQDAAELLGIDSQRSPASPAASSAASAKPSSWNW